MPDQVSFSVALRSMACCVAGRLARSPSQRRLRTVTHDASIRRRRRASPASRSNVCIRNTPTTSRTPWMTPRMRVRRASSLRPSTAASTGIRTCMDTGSLRGSCILILARRSQTAHAPHSRRALPPPISRGSSRICSTRAGPRSSGPMGSHGSLRSLPNCAPGTIRRRTPGRSSASARSGSRLAPRELAAETSLSHSHRRARSDRLLIRSHVGLGGHRP